MMKKREQEPQTLTGPQVLEKLKTGREKGLSPGQVQQRQAVWGKNELEGAKKEGPLRRFFRQFADFMILVLLAAALISGGVSLWQGEGLSPDPLIILGIVTCNALIGTVQESRAEKAIDALKKLSAPKARVRRGGQVGVVDANELVPGDILLLKAGDIVPADGRLLLENGMKTDESALTGESVPVPKNAGQLAPQGAPPAECANMAYAGTSVVAGDGEMVVTQTGMHTHMGQIASMLAQSEAPRTPLQEKLARMGKTLGLAVLGICAALFLLGVVQHRDVLPMFLIAVSLAVAAIPEGLPAVVTVVLACGVRRLAGRKAVIRRLPAVETLGSAGVICTDKTGTLTCGHMTVTKVSSGLTPYDLSSPQAQEILGCCALCSSCEEKRGKIEGEPTEKALVQACRTPLGQLREKFPTRRQIPFSSKEKQMTSLHEGPGGQGLMVVKGAPEIILARCDSRRVKGGPGALSPEERGRILKENEQMAGQALRVLAVGVYRGPLPGPGREGSVPLCFLGLVGMEDPPRKGVKQAVRVCRKAGIRVVMITGDQPATAAAIAQQIGLTNDGTVITGRELDQMTDETLWQRAQTCRVFARVQPKHKVQLVSLFQKRGFVTAMTGDGINDAPALRMADIGCAMGKGGTQVARQAADMVLADDRFETIVEAVRQGRAIFENIRKTVHFLLSCNTGEILTVLLAFLLGWPEPLLAVQLLWVNLVTDSLPALALGVDPCEDGLMDRPPRPGRRLFEKGEGVVMLLEGCLIGALALLAFVLGQGQLGSAAAGRTMAFGVLSFSQLVHTLNMHARVPICRGGLRKSGRLLAAALVGALLQTLVMVVPVLGAVFGTVGLPLFAWGEILFLSFMPLIPAELGKLGEGRRRHRRRRARN
ncbi:MAG TPA: cation-translocating P-type ATPase [Firmicutes bacterium]|nr:cation-translocating P-type ATPase [Bacillota bacterium]